MGLKELLTEFRKNYISHKIEHLLDRQKRAASSYERSALSSEIRTLATRYHDITGRWYVKVHEKPLGTVRNDNYINAEGVNRLRR